MNKNRLINNKLNMEINFFQTSVDKNEIDAVVKVMESGMIAEGNDVRKLEYNFNQYITNNQYFPIAVSNGTTALDLALKSLEINENHEVIVPDFTFIATANSVLFQNAKVVFADVELDTYNISLEDIIDKTTVNTKAIIVVHLFWRPIENIQEISSYCEKNNIYLIEDCAQAHWAEINGKKIGSFGDISCFSFYATKNMCTAEWWMTLFKNEKHFNEWKLIYNHGQSEKYLHTALGYNFRMTNIQAAIWNVQLNKIDSLNDQRIENASLYNNILKNQNFIQLPKDIENGKNVFHQYTLLVNDNSFFSRDELMSKLSEKWIPTAIHYPYPIHKQPYYVWLGYDDNICQKSTNLSKNIFSLPIYPWLEKEKIEYIANTLLNLLK